MKALSFLKRNIAGLLTFLVCTLFAAAAVSARAGIERMTMEQLLMAKSTRVNDILSPMVYFRADLLSALVVENDNYTEDFYRISPSMVEYSPILYVLAAPSGIVSCVYPREGNEQLLGMDILKDGIGVTEAVLAKESGELVMGGPFEISEGVSALIVRMPVYSENPDGSSEFWGLVSVALKFPDVMTSIGLDELETQGFSYEIYKIRSDGTKQILLDCPQNQELHARSLEEEINILNDKWYFSIFSLKHWYEDPYTWIFFVCGAFLSILVARLQTVTSRAKGASRAKSDFLASMSHEIRTPMNAIIGMSELLIQEQLTPRQLEYASDIRTSSTALLGIINDILDVSKIESGKFAVNPVHFDLPALIKNAADVMSFAAEEKKLEFILEIHEPVERFVHGDDVRLRQILLNLLGNAIKFTDKGFVKLGVSYSEGVCRLEIADSGIGIKESDLARLYDSFEQFDPNKNRGKQGTGLGLSITKSLTGMMGGEIDVHSVYGEGTVFRVSLPLPPGDASLVAGGGVYEFVTAENARVLLAEDNEMNRRVADGLLRLHGIECDTAENGVEAIRKVKQKDYDLVLMDYMMPVMDGIEAAEKIRALGGKYKQGSLAIIAFTADIMPEAKEAFALAGMDDFLPKPVDKTQLNNMLAKWLPKEKQKISVIEKQPTGAQETEYSPALQKACEIEGLDVKLGLSHVAGREDYERSLRLLCGTIPRSLAEMSSYLENGELGKFAIDIHGMKGALAVNGHIPLSERAKALEYESKKGELEFCKENFPYFARELSVLAEAIAQVFSDGEADKPEGSRDMLEESLAEIEECIARCDREGALSELTAACGYSFGADIDEKLGGMTAALEDFDFERAAELLDGIEL